MRVCHRTRPSGEVQLKSLFAMISVGFPCASKNLVSTSQRAFPSGSKPSGRVASVMRAGGAPKYAAGDTVARGAGAKNGATKKLASTRELFALRFLLPLPRSGYFDSGLFVKHANHQNHDDEDE